MVNITAPAVTDTQQPKMLSLTDVLTAANQQNTQAQQTAQQARQDYSAYLNGSRNPIADIINQQKPVRKTSDENRQKEVAKWAAISEGISAIGKSIANYSGVRTQPTENKALLASMSKLKQLDDIYQQEDYRYNQNLLLDAIRNQGRADNAQTSALQAKEHQAQVAQAKVDKLEQLGLELDISDEQRDKEHRYQDGVRKQERQHQWGLSTYRAESKGEQPLYNVMGLDGKPHPMYDYEEAEHLI